MGLYDTLTINLSRLPISKSDQKLLKKEDFQTKDLDNCLSEYRITDDGFLEEHLWEWEIIPESERTPIENPSLNSNKRCLIYIMTFTRKIGEKK